MGNLLKAVRRVTRYMTEDEDDFVKLNIKAENDDERKKILDVLEDFAGKDDSDLKFTVDEDDDKSIEVEVPKDQVEEVSKALDKACPGAKCEAEDDDEDKKEESDDDADPDNDKEKNESVRDFLTRRRLSESKRRKKNEEDDPDDEEDKKDESDSDDDEDDDLKESRRKKRRNEDDDEYSDDELEESKRRKKSKKNEDDDEDDIEDPVEEDEDSDNDEEDKKEEAEEDEKDKETVEESIKTILKSLKLTEAEAVGIRAIFLEAVETVASRKISRYIRKAQVTENRRVRTATNHLKEDINKYLTYAAKTWVKDNYVPLREGIEAQFVSKALDGIKSMLSESNITTPTGKASIEQMKTRLTATEKQLHEAMIALKTRDKDISELKLTRLVESIANKFDMTDSERVRFAKLAKTQRVDECTEESLGAIATLICEGSKGIPSKDKEHLKEETSSKARYIDYLSKPYSE